MDEYGRISAVIVCSREMDEPRLLRDLFETFVAGRSDSHIYSAVSAVRYFTPDGARKLRSVRRSVRRVHALDDVFDRPAGEDSGPLGIEMDAGPRGKVQLLAPSPWSPAPGPMKRFELFVTGYTVDALTDGSVADVLTAIVATICRARHRVFSGNAWFGTRGEPYLDSVAQSQWGILPIRGYDWLAVLSETIATALGDPGLSRCPGEVKEHVDASDGSSAWIVVMRRNPFAATDNDLRALRSYLRPLLPTEAVQRRVKRMAEDPDYLERLPDRLRRPPPFLLAEDWLPDL